MNGRALSPLAQIAQQLEKKNGSGSVVVLGSRAAESVPVIPTGSLQLDHALGCGGLPRGRIIEIYGPESSGKTTLALHAIAEVQKLGGYAAFVDVEHALDAVYAARLGVDPERVLLSQPDYGEQALDIVQSMVATGQIDLIVLDSVAALVPKAELDGEMGDAFVGVHARLMSQALRKLTGLAATTGCTILFINQIREKIGVMFGSPETTTGGRALKFFASVRLDVRKLSVVKDGEEIRGNRVKVKVVKNKMAAPFREVEFEIRFGRGIDRLGELVDASVETAVLQKSGSWFSYGDQRLGQGREQAREALEGAPVMRGAIEDAVLRKLGLDYLDAGTKQQRVRPQEAPAIPEPVRVAAAAS
ncbi:recombinase RecA [Bryobacter aggregatus]|uniref:recombinase RecA n=1 Tax=Bryobacter aggregatus TaxID=360054 RepID=UPI0009B5C54B|nr:recombinase RecA [Bryobacter aggregatus]